MTAVRSKRPRTFALTLSLSLVPAWSFAQTVAGEAPKSPDPADSVGEADLAPPSNPPTLPESGFELGLGVGFAMPVGSADSGAFLFDTGGQAPNTGLQIRDGKMRGIVAYRVSLMLDLGYRLSPSWWVGVRPEAGTGAFGTECPTQANCNWSDARLGAVAKYHLDPASLGDPWIGLNLGWEWLRSTATVVLPPEVTGLSSSQAVSAKQTISGPILELLGGLNFDFGQHIHAGPFLSAAVGRYFRSSFDCPTAALGCPDPSWIEDGKFHGWLSVGISGAHGP